MLPPSRDLVLVTGAGGFVGRRVVPALLAAGYRVRAMGRRPLPMDLRAPGIEEWHGDLTDAGSVAAAVSGATAVLHLAALLGDATGVAALRAVNVEGTRALARAARAAGVGTFIHLGSAGVYGDGEGEVPRPESTPCKPTTAYERSKLEAEAALGEELSGSRPAWVVLRPGGLYGADRPESQAFVRTVQRRRVWLHGPMHLLLHPTHVDDVVSALLLALARAAEVGGTVFNVAGERPISFSDWIDVLAARLGAHPVHVRLPRAAGRVVAAAARAAWGATGRPAPPRLARLAGGTINRALDTTLARRRLGWEPIPMALGLDELLARRPAPTGRARSARPAHDGSSPGAP